MFLVKASSLGVGVKLPIPLQIQLDQFQILSTFRSHLLHPGQDQLLFGTTPDGALAYIRIRELDPLTRDLEAFTFPMLVARLDDLSPEAVIDLLLPEEGSG